jgi:hypothetical protein
MFLIPFILTRDIHVRVRKGRVHACVRMQGDAIFALHDNMLTALVKVLHAFCKLPREQDFLMSSLISCIEILVPTVY